VHTWVLGRISPNDHSHLPLPVPGGVAVIRVGGSTEVEVKEKKGRVDDAMHATKAAVEEGIVPGGGVALLRAKTAIGKLSDDNADIQAGINIVLRALEALRHPTYHFQTKTMSVRPLRDRSRTRSGATNGHEPRPASGPSTQKRIPREFRADADGLVHVCRPAIRF
jgi:hypothetical protein